MRRMRDRGGDCTFLVGQVAQMRSRDTVILAMILYEAEIEGGGYWCRNMLPVASAALAERETTVSLAEGEAVGK